MAGKLIGPPACICGLVLDIGRAYSAEDAAHFLGVNVFVLNQRVREGKVKPVFDTGDRRYSGYVLARLLDWPLSEDPRDYVPSTPCGRRHISKRRAREEGQREAIDEILAEEERVSHGRSGSFVESLASSRGSKSKTGPARSGKTGGSSGEDKPGSGTFAGYVSSRGRLGRVMKRS